MHCCQHAVPIVVTVLSMLCLIIQCELRCELLMFLPNVTPSPSLVGPLLSTDVECITENSATPTLPTLSDTGP